MWLTLYLFISYKAGPLYFRNLLGSDWIPKDKLEEKLGETLSDPEVRWGKCTGQIDQFLPRESYTLSNWMSLAMSGSFYFYS